MLKEKTEIEMQRAEYIEKLGLTLKAEFVPYSQSRNKFDEHKSLNWAVQLLVEGKVVLLTDYMQGIGHLPNHECTSRKVMEKMYSDWACESGRFMTEYQKDTFITGRDSSIPARAGVPLPVPSTEDVLYSLLMDSDVLNYSGFVEWADSVGYDTDSRKAENTHAACMGIALQLKNGIGFEAMEKLNELFQDY